MSETKKVYLSGPMRGYAEFNFPAFFDKEAELIADGCEVFNPARKDVDKGLDVTGLTGSNEELAALGFDVREALEMDTRYICREATHIFMLPGWSRSTGATAERALALALGLTVEGEPA